jgi:transposase-like protein
MGSRHPPVDAVSSPSCPFCSAGRPERVGQWGGQIITAHWRCNTCGSYFEALREEFDDQAAARPPASIDRK